MSIRGWRFGLRTRLRGHTRLGLHTWNCARKSWPLSSPLQHHPFSLQSPSEGSLSTLTCNFGSKSSRRLVLVRLLPRFLLLHLQHRVLFPLHLPRQVARCLRRQSRQSRRFRLYLLCLRGLSLLRPQPLVVQSRRHLLCLHASLRHPRRSPSCVARSLQPAPPSRPPWSRPSVHRLLLGLRRRIAPRPLPGCPLRSVRDPRLWTSQVRPRGRTSRFRRSSPSSLAPRRRMSLRRRRSFLRW